MGTISSVHVKTLPAFPSAANPRATTSLARLRNHLSVITKRHVLFVDWPAYNHSSLYTHHRYLYGVVRYFTSFCMLILYFLFTQHHSFIAPWYPLFRKIKCLFLIMQKIFNFCTTNHYYSTNLVILINRDFKIVMAMRPHCKPYTYGLYANASDTYLSPCLYLSHAAARHSTCHHSLALSLLSFSSRYGEHF